MGSITGIMKDKIQRMIYNVYTCLNEDNRRFVKIASKSFVDISCRHCGVAIEKDLHDGCGVVHGDITRFCKSAVEIFVGQCSLASKARE